MHRKIARFLINGWPNYACPEQRLSQISQQADALNIFIFYRASLPPSIVCFINKKLNWSWHLHMNLQDLFLDPGRNVQFIPVSGIPRWCSWLGSVTLFDLRGTLKMQPRPRAGWQTQNSEGSTVYLLPAKSLDSNLAWGGRQMSLSDCSVILDVTYHEVFWFHI